ncbi:MAG: biotin--[Bacteroidales bacterium]|nr:biotin--[acetyl-CoA-carboxylase] ligase [Bacteroidales bacterium]
MMPYRILYLDSVDSTNAHLLEKPEKERVGLVVCAREQTAGKGMASNVWESKPGENLTFSMGADLSFMKAADQFLLSQAVPLGILDVLDAIIVGQTHGSAPTGMLTVKWPNDLLFENRKLCGILINSTIHGVDMGVSVIGIGLNVNQMQFKDWPTHPISMKMILGEEVELEPLLHQLVASVDQRIQLLRTAEGVAKIKEDYLSRLYRYHQWGLFETDEGTVKRYVDGIDEFGRLKVVNEDGKSRVYDVKEIKFL